jgi:uroporphyrinogen decarboxylase
VKAKIAVKYPGQQTPPLTIFARNSHYAIGDLAETDYDVIGLDWSVDPAVAA